LGGLDLSLQHPLFLLNYAVFQSLNLLLKCVLFLRFDDFFLLVLHLDLPEMVELVVEGVFSFILALVVLLLNFLFALACNQAFLLLKLPILFGVTLVLVRLHLFLIDFLAVQSHILLILCHGLIL